MAQETRVVDDDKSSVRREWLRRVEAEYRSAALMQHLTLWLIQLGTSPDLVRAGQRIVRDELVHASMSHRVYRAAGGQGKSRIERESLELARTPGAPLEDDVARTCVDLLCLGETAAVRLFAELRRRCDVPVARRALDRVLRDEVRHRDFGWTLLGWLLESPQHGARLRRLVAAELPASFARVRSVYGPSEARASARSREALELPKGRLGSLRSASRASTTVPRGDTRWGLMPASRYGEVLERTFEREYIARFARLGIDARAAWTAVAEAAAAP
jgi:hypothetical protein